MNKTRKKRLTRALGAAVVVMMMLSIFVGSTITAAANESPHAEAGDSREVTVVNTPVTLGGGISDIEDWPWQLSIMWTIDNVPAGSTITLSSFTAQYPTFTPDKVGNYVFTQIVTDTGGLSDTDSVTITATNIPPVAEAGPDSSLEIYHSKTLVGDLSHETDNHLPITYLWTVDKKPAGSSITLANPTDSRPSFTPDKVGDYVFTLTVTDNLGLSSTPDSVTITATNAPPVPNALQDQTVTVNTLVTLGGGVYDPGDHYPLSFAWTVDKKPAGSAIIIDTTAQYPTFTPDKAGYYVFTQIVTDHYGASSTPDTVTVTAKGPTTLTAIVNGNHQTTETKNGKFTISGTHSTDTGPLAGQPVYLEALYNGDWYRISLDKVTGPQGQYSFRGYITVANTAENPYYSIRAHFAGTSIYGESVSDTITVIVTETK